jgi:hypothetical protein
LASTCASRWRLTVSPSRPPRGVSSKTNVGIQAMLCQISIDGVIAQ